MKTAVIYCRVSSTNERQDTGLNAQLSKLRTYAKEHSYKVLNEFTEHISGAKKKSERKALTDCFNFCKENGVSTLLISELSRLGRSMADVFNTVNEAGENGLTIIQVKDGTQIENQSIGGKAILFSLSLAAEIERENIKYRLDLGRKTYIEQGGKLGRKEGYRKPKDDKQKEYKSVIDLLTAAKQLRDAGQKVPDTLQIREIAKTCSVGVSTVQRLKKEFNL